MAQHQHQPPQSPPGRQRGHGRRRQRLGADDQLPRRHGLLALALLLGGASIAGIVGVGAQPASLLLAPELQQQALRRYPQQHQQHQKQRYPQQHQQAPSADTQIKGGLRGAAGSAAIDAAGVRREGPSAAGSSSNASRSAAARAEDALLQVLHGPLTPTQFSRLDFPIPKTLRAREALRLEGDGFSSSGGSGGDVRGPAAAKGGKKGAADRRHGNGSESMAAAAVSVGRQHHEIVVDRYEDGPDGACGDPGSDVGKGGADEKKGQAAMTPLHPTCNLRAALRWAAERHRRRGRREGEEETVVTVYLPTRWPHLLTLGELAVAEEGCVRCALLEPIQPHGGGGRRRYHGKLT